MRPFSSLVALGAALVSLLSGRVVTTVEPSPPPIHVVAEPVEATAPPSVVAWAEALPALRFVNTRTGAEWALPLPADGTVDERAAAAINAVLAERDAAPRPCTGARSA